MTSANSRKDKRGASQRNSEVVRLSSTLPAPDCDAAMHLGHSWLFPFNKGRTPDTQVTGWQRPQRLVATAADARHSHDDSDKTTKTPPARPSPDGNDSDYDDADPPTRPVSAATTQTTRETPRPRASVRRPVPGSAATTTQTTTQTQETTSEPGATDQPAATPSGQVTKATAADIKAGASVYDETGALVGKVDKVDADGAIVNTGKVRAQIPLASFGKNDKGLVVTATKASLDAQAKETKTKTKTETKTETETETKPKS